MNSTASKLPRAGFENDSADTQECSSVPARSQNGVGAGVLPDLSFPLITADRSNSSTAFTYSGPLRLILLAQVEHLRKTQPLISDEQMAATLGIGIGRVRRLRRRLGKFGVQDAVGVAHG